MLPLAFHTLKTADDLRDSLVRGLRGVIELPREDRSVLVRGHGFPSVTGLEVDLSAARIDPDRTLPVPPAEGRSASGPRIAVERFHVWAEPLYVGPAAVHLDLAATAAAFGLVRDRQRQYWLVLEAAEAGNAEVRVSRSDLDAALLEVMRAVAGRQGIDVREAHIDLEARGRSVEAALHLTVRKLVSARLVITGAAVVEDDLTARLDGLACQGEGTVGRLACGLVRPRLAQLDGARIPLTGLPFAGVTLEDVAVEADSRSVRVTAEFGGAREGRASPVRGGRRGKQR